MKSIELYNDGIRRWVCIGRDPKKPEILIDTNEYLITNEGKGILLDPGGMEIFPAVVSSVSREIRMDDIEVLFASHQDPDICSSVSLWLGVCHNAKFYAPSIWSSFIPHFGGGDVMVQIPDEGMALPLGRSSDLTAIPAHYLHSSGNFSVYDPKAKILFSGDIGAALLPKEKGGFFVENFSEHIRYMEGFHKRWMPSNEAKQNWVERIRKLDVEIICPQHGAIFKDENVNKFLDWFEELEVGSATLKG